MGYKYFPLFFDISNIRILVVGAGTIASRRVETLLPFATTIHVAAPHISDEMRRLAQDSKIVLVQEEFRQEQLKDVQLVLACTSDKEVNRLIYTLCKEAGIPVNNCMDREQCDFYFPAIVHTGNLVIGISSDGTRHREVKEMRKAIEKLNS